MVDDYAKVKNSLEYSKWRYQHLSNEVTVHDMRLGETVAVAGKLN